MGRRADSEDDVWVEFGLALRHCIYLDSDSVRAALREYGLTISRIEKVNANEKMFCESFDRKPPFKILFVRDPSDPQTEIARDFAASLEAAKERANTLLPQFLEKGAKAWRITDQSDRQVAIGPEP